MKEWSDPERVAEYLSREIPHRQTAEAMLLQALPERVDRFLDLGTGDGRLVSDAGGWNRLLAALPTLTTPGWVESPLRVPSG
jgi:hypothetical protein